MRLVSWLLVEGPCSFQVNLCRAAWVSSWHGSWFSPEWTVKESRSCNAFYDLVPEVALFYFHSVLLIHRSALFCVERDDTGEWIPGGENPWKPSWRLTTATALRVPPAQNILPPNVSMAHILISSRSLPKSHLIREVFPELSPVMAPLFYHALSSYCFILP